MEVSQLDSPPPPPASIFPLCHDFIYNHKNVDMCTGPAVNALGYHKYSDELVTGIGNGTFRELNQGFVCCVLHMHGREPDGQQHE